MSVTASSPLTWHNRQDFLEEDLELFWEALKNMFDVDRSAARGLMSAQKTDSLQA